MLTSTRMIITLEGKASRGMHALLSRNKALTFTSSLLPPCRIQPRTFGTNSSSAEDDKEANSIIYKSKMGSLITRLKVISISSCLMSLLGLPIAIAIKNGDLPTAKQLGLGGVALFGATGSTLALHFVFGPYILEMEEITVRQCHYKKSDEQSKETAESSSDPSVDAATADVSVAAATVDTPETNHHMIKATTRSVFGWRKEIVFDPATDVTQYAGTRPFANFMAKDTVLYAHPELLEDKLRLQLLFSKHQPEQEETKETKDDDLF